MPNSAIANTAIGMLWICTSIRDTGTRNAAIRPVSLASR